jgi:hypothetical protein
MTEAVMTTVGIEGLGSGAPRARLRRGTRKQLTHDHSAAGLRVRGSSGTQYQWCSGCGALGVCKDGGDPVWIVPGADAEDMVIDVMAALR